jgi:hypothetical protein
MTDDTTLPTTLDTGRRQVSTLDRLADIHEEEKAKQDMLDNGLGRRCLAGQIEHREREGPRLRRLSEPLSP